MKRTVPILIVNALLLLAAIGLASTIVSNPAVFIRNVLVGVGILVVLYLVYQRFIRTRQNQQERHAYASAARTSTKKKRRNTLSGSGRAKQYPHGLSVITRGNLSLKPKRKSEVHLTVIEGKKTKKKSRAFF